MEKIKKGLILEGGAMRGMFTAGVLDVFMENRTDWDDSFHRADHSRHQEIQ